MPVTTRRSTARSKPTRTYQAHETLDDLDSSSSQIDSEDDDSDWELGASRHKKGTRGKPRKKRARLDSGRRDSYHATSGGKGITSSTGKLDVFPSLPLDIIYEVLCLLSPVDLANLAQTNRAFRTTLTSDAPSSRIWNAARKLHGNGPECPPDVGLVPWVRFVYGPPKCGLCGVTNVHFIDFKIRRRLCKKCRKQKLVYSGFVAKRFPDIDTGILELIPYTWIGGAKAGRGREKSKFYWEDDIYAMAADYAQFQSDVYRRKPGAKDALQKFRSERIEYVQAVEEHAKRCVAQWSELVQFRSRQAREHSESQYTEIVNRFRQLGYETVDISSIRYAAGVNRNRAAITEGVWTHIKGSLQRTIEAARCRRLEQEKPFIISARKRLVKNAYNDYKRTLRPIEWVSLPPPQLIYVMPAFRELIYTRLDEPLDQATCDAAAERLPKYISTFMDALKLHLLQQMANEYMVHEPGKRAKRVAKRDGDDKLYLAATVFNGPTTNSANLHAFGEIVAYLSSLAVTGGHDSEAYIYLLETRRFGSWDSLCSYEDIGCRTTVILLTALGLDPATTRPEDLDEVDRRIVCERCSSLDARAYSWRHLVRHHCTVHRFSQPRLRVLSVEESAAARRSQGADPAAQQSMWSCNHCAAHLDSLDMRSIVETHVRETHAIAEPQEGVDFFHALPAMRMYPDPPPYPGGLVA